MTEELAGMKRYIESTGRARVLLERNDFLLVEWNDVPEMPKRYYRLHAFPYAKSGMGNNEPWSCKITDEQAEYFLARPDQAERYFKYKHTHFGGVKIHIWRFNDITDINAAGVGFKDGYFARFEECVHYGFPENGRFIGEYKCESRLNRASIELQSHDRRDIVIFDSKKRGTLLKKKNEREFQKLLQAIRGYGYSILDLS